MATWTDRYHTNYTPRSMTRPATLHQAFAGTCYIVRACVLRSNHAYVRPYSTQGMSAPTRPPCARTPGASRAAVVLKQGRLCGIACVPSWPSRLTTKSDLGVGLIDEWRT